MEPEKKELNNEPAKEQPVQQESAPAKGYGKRPVWQWVLIYVVAAIIVYGLIYLIFIHKSGGGSSY